MNSCHWDCSRLVWERQSPGRCSVSVRIWVWGKAAWWWHQHWAAPLFTKPYFERCPDGGKQKPAVVLWALNTHSSAADAHCQMVPLDQPEPCSLFLVFAAMAQGMKAITTPRPSSVAPSTEYTPTVSSGAFRWVLGPRLEVDCMASFPSQHPPSHFLADGHLILASLFLIVCSRDSRDPSSSRGQIGQPPPLQRPTWRGLPPWLRPRCFL